MFLSNKKSQSAEFLSIIILILIVSIFALFSKVSLLGSNTQQTVSAIKTMKSTKLSLTANILPRITIGDENIGQALGEEFCYGNETILLQSGQKINITAELRKVLDSIYGKNNWMLRIKKGKYVMPDLYFYVDCSGSTVKTRQKVEAAMAKIAQTKHSKYKIICIGDLTNAVGKYSNASDDLACGRGDVHKKNIETDENWGGAVAFVALNGIPSYNSTTKKYAFNGWNTTHRYILISGDEESCSSCMPLNTTGSQNSVCRNFCLNANLPANCPCYFTDYYCTTGGRWVKRGSMIFSKSFDIGCHGEPGNTTAYTDFAIKRAKENNVSVFFIIPTKIYVNNKTEWLNNVRRLCNETGGQVIDLRNDSMSKKEIVMTLSKLLYRDEETVYITSTYEGPQFQRISENLISYPILISSPCDTEEQENALLMVRD